ncbi:hypothetical protein KAU39_04360 [bacterium]|nr:hypothetical protein [bacterium]
MNIRKTIVFLVLFGMLSSMAFADFSSVSVRMQGINPSLAGIMADEYSDAMANPADLLTVEGYRVFTNLSNLYGGMDGRNIGNDRALNGTTTGGTGASQFLLGAFGNPFLGSYLPDSQLGLLYNSGSSLIVLPNHNSVWPPLFPGVATTGEISKDDTFRTDADNNGSYGDVGDSTVLSGNSTNRYREEYEKSLNFLFAHQVNPDLKVGIDIGTSNLDLDGNCSSEEIIKARDYQSTTVIISTTTTPATTVDTYEDSLSAKETHTNSILEIAFGGRFQVNPDLNVGARVNIMPVSFEYERDGMPVVSESHPVGSPGADTAVETGVDLSVFALAGLSGLVNRDFSWTGNFFTGTVLDANEVGSQKEDGTGLGLVLDSFYSITPEVTLTGAIIYQSVPRDISASISTPYSLVQTGVTVDGDRVVVDDDNTVINFSGDVKDSTIGITLGGEAKLVDNVLLGFGLNYCNQTEEINGTAVTTTTNIDSYDEDNDGNVTDDPDDPADTDYQTTRTDIDTGSHSSEIKTNTIQFPIGLEMRPWKKFAVRLGVTHQIRTVKETTTDCTTSDGWWHEETVSNGVVVTSDETGGTKTTSDKRVESEENTTRSTQYYYGIGYDWSENISFDILGVAGSWTILDLGSWRIGCTMKF